MDVWKTPGKSTLLNEVQKRYKFDVVIVLEMTDDWTLLKARYQNPERFSFSLQMQIMLSQYNTIVQALETAPPECYIIVERSIRSALVFGKDALENKCMSNDEYTMLCDYATLLENSLHDRFNIVASSVYLKCNPAACLTRIGTRKRPCEAAITVDYLQSLDDKFDNFCKPARTIQSGAADADHFDSVCDTVVRAAAGTLAPA